MMEKQKLRIKTVCNTLSILKELAGADQPLDAKGIAEGLSLSIGTVHRLLGALRAEGAVTFDPDLKTYAIGPEMLRLSSIAIRQSALISVSKALMRELVSIADETVCLNLYDPISDQCSILAFEEPSRELRYVVEVGKLLPLHAGAGGLAILAHLPADSIDRLLVDPAADKRASKVTTEAAKLRRQLGEIAKMGYAISHGERVEAVVMIAAPVFDVSGSVVASIQFAIPAHRFEKARLPHLVSLVKAYADKLAGLVKAS